MRYRTFGRTGWSVSEIGYGMWGLAAWPDSNDDETWASLERSVQLGCNFFDTAWAYGDGRSEQFLGRLVRNHPDKQLYVATKIPPKNRKWPSRRGFQLDDVFPPDYIREYAEKSLRNLELTRIDLLQFHVWEDDWARDERWQRVVDDLKRQALIRAVGISVNRWEPENVLETLRTGLIDAVQVIYNIFDQAPRDELFPLCRELNIGVIARVPFDEGTLTGTLTKESRWPEGDWRNTYFVKENLEASVNRAEAPAARDPGRDDDARAGAPLYPGRSDGLDGHPRHAEAAARRGQHRRQRREAARPGFARTARGPSLGPDADGMVAVRGYPDRLSGGCNSPGGH